MKARQTRLASSEKLVESLNQEDTLKKFLPKIRLLARHVAASMSAQAHYDDLVSAGMVGLMDAFEKFDTHKLVKFKTYAEIRMRGAMIDELRSQSWVPRSLQNHSKQVEKIHEKFEESVGRRATDAEVSAEMGLDQEKCRQMSQQGRPARVLNIDDYRHFNESDRESLVTQSSAENEFNPAFVSDRNQTRALLEKVTSHLSPKQREVITLFYFDGLKNVEISRKLGISESRVCQIHNEAMHFLRRNRDMQVILMCLYKDLAA